MLFRSDRALTMLPELVDKILAMVKKDEAAAPAEEKAAPQQPAQPE